MGDKSHTNSPKAGSSKQAAAPSAFTAEMRDRQARGKNPYDSDSDDSEWDQAQTRPQRVGDPKPKDRFAQYERRRMALQILGNTELLMMAAARDDESLAATRLKYTRILCGLDGESKDGAGGTGKAAATTVATRASSADKQRKQTNLEAEDELEDL